MRTIQQILNLVVDGEITTVEQARQLLTEEAPETRILIETATHYCSPPTAAKIRELFELTQGAK